MKRIVFSLIMLVCAASLHAGEKGEAEYLQRGTGYLAAGDYAKAIKVYDQALRLNPASAQAQHGLGMGYLKLGDNGVSTNPEMLEKAAQAFHLALDLDPNRADSRYNLGIVYLSLHNRNGAVKECEALEGLDKALARSLSDRIRAYTPPKVYRAEGPSREPAGKVVTGRSSGAPNKAVRYGGAVEVFTRAGCPWCTKMEEFLRSKGIRYTKHDIDKDNDAARTFKELGGRGVPLTRVGSKVVHGFNPDEVIRYLEQRG